MSDKLFASKWCWLIIKLRCTHYLNFNFYYYNSNFVHCDFSYHNYVLIESIIKIIIDDNSIVKFSISIFLRLSCFYSLHLYKKYVFTRNYFLLRIHRSISSMYMHDKSFLFWCSLVNLVLKSLYQHLPWNDRLICMA